MGLDTESVALHLLQLAIGHDEGEQLLVARVQTDVRQLVDGYLQQQILPLVVNVHGLVGDCDGGGDGLALLVVDACDGIHADLLPVGRRDLDRAVQPWDVR